MSINKSKESAEKTNKENSSMLSKAQEDFIFERTKWDVNYFEWYKANIFEDFLRFIKSKNNFKELHLELVDSDTKKQEAIKSQIFSEVLKTNIPRKNNIKKLSKNYQNEYNLWTDEIKLIEKEINNFKNIDLINYLWNSSKRLDFLVKIWIFNKKEEALNNKKNIENKILSEIKISKTNFDKLTQEQKNILFLAFNNNSKINIEDFKNLFNILDKTSKINIIKYFLDKISYKDLENLSILDKNLKEKIFKNFKTETQKYDLNIKDEEIKDIFDSIDKSTIFVDISNLDVSKIVNSDLLKEKILKNYNDDIEINNSVKTESDSILSKLKPNWKNEDINDSFINFIEKEQDISKNIKNNIKKLKNWNIIELYNWKSSTYYKIEKVDNWSVLESKSIKLIDITAPNWFRKDEKWEEKIYSYDSFYNLLKRVSYPENKELELNFCEKNEIKEKEIVDDNNIQTIEELENKLNIIDSEWKDIKFNKDEVSIYFEKENFVFLVEEINDWYIKINTWAWKFEKVSFSDFYTTFVKEKLKRNKKLNTFEELLNHSAWKWNKIFEWLKLWWKNKDKIIFEDDEQNEEVDNKDYTWVKFLIWEWWDAIYINEISNDKIDYTFWKYKEWSNQKDEKDWKDKKKKKDDFKWKYRSNNFSQFFADIEKHSLKAKTDNIKSQTKTKEEEKGEKELKGSFFTRFMSGLTIWDILQWLKFFPDTIAKNLERWNKLRSLKFAQKLAKITWKDSSFYLDMKSAAEQEEKSLTEELTNNLKALWSKDMLIKIEKILKNSDTPEYELMAAMMAVVSKYGSLYPKSLKKYDWSLLWYKRLWWTDAFKQKYEDEIKNLKTADWKPQPVFFTEERLVENLLWKRAKEWTIRSRADKDFWNALSAWMKEEMEDWDMKAGNKFTTEWRIQYFVWELGKLWYANATWSLEKILAKNGSAIDMHAAPFILTISWLSKNFDQVLLNKLAWLGFSTPFSSFYFATSSAWINLYTKFIKTLISDKFKDNKEMYTDFQAISEKTDPEEKVDKTYDFWRKYGPNLVKYINLSDPYVILAKNKNPIYKEYYEQLKWIHDDEEFSLKEEDLTIWVYWKNPLTFTRKKLLSKITTDTTWSLWSPISKKVYKMFIESIKTIWNNNDKDISEEEKKAFFKEQFESFSDHIKEKYWRFSGNETTPFIKTMKNELWTWLYDENKYSSKEEYLEEAYNNFKNLNLWLNNTSDIEEDTKTEIDDVINNSDYKNKI